MIDKSGEKPAARAGEDVVERAKVAIRNAAWRNGAVLANSLVEDIAASLLRAPEDATLECVSQIVMRWADDTFGSPLSFLARDDLLSKLSPFLRAPEAPGWQPIETAPRDRKILLGKIVGHPDHPTSLWWACSGAWSERFKNWNDGVEPSGLSGPTHWSEFPKTPGAA